MLYQCDDNYELFIEYIRKLSALIEESPILGNFNAGTDTPFEAELRELCINLDLVVSDCEFYGRTSGMLTHVSNAHGSTSWLDHVICIRDMQAKLQSIFVLDMLPSSDHLSLLQPLLLLTSLHVPASKLILIGQKQRTKIY